MFNRSVNKVVLIGNLGKSPEIKYLPNGNAVANFSIATSESWKNKQTGEYESHSEWHNIVVYGKLAELCGQYIKKGVKVCIEGKLKTRKWQDTQSGQDRYSTEIIASEVENMDKVEQAQPQPAHHAAPAYQPQPAHHAAPAYQPQPAQPPVHKPMHHGASKN